MNEVTATDMVGAEDTKTPREPRITAVERSWKTFSKGSAFGVFIYPLLSVLLLGGVLVAGAVSPAVTVELWYAVPAVFTFVLVTMMCNFGIGSLHRVWQHRGARMSNTGQFLVALHCILAMQGPLREWIVYHAEHHRFADQPGDPHNPAESVFWAWFGWVLWRDPVDMARPWPKWLIDNELIQWADRVHMPLSGIVHLLVPIVAYLLTYLLDGSLALAALIHATAALARGVHFHSTILGINVLGHMDVPKWVTWTIALATGGEAFHDHHHTFPRSILHLPRKGLVNRLVDYNGTFLLIMRKFGMLDDERIAPQFA